MNRLIIYTVLVLAFSCLASSETVKCYECDSRSTPACLDPFSSSGSGVTTRDCATGQVCMKDKTYGTVLGVAVNTVTRGCSAAPDPNSCAPSTAAGLTTEVCGCSTTLCNAAVTFRSTVGSALVLSGIVMLLQRL